MFGISDEMFYVLMPKHESKKWEPGAITGSTVTSLNS
jgi:hypothetical protein